ncbi:class I SAM-dependent DNA methyltransferase [Leucobacter luti]|nr:DNA methyltransferase [Leucobacter luti]MBL3698998.1 class I SAM-dependent DNA methyltransferase [Leucobacter luti]
MNAIRSRAAKLSIDWKDVPATEKQHAQSFVRDLLGVYGITETRAAFYEKRVKRSSTGGDGYIDALIPGVLAIEMKSAGEDLEKAERQALDYLDDLPDAEMPRWVLSCDFRRFRLLDIHADRQDPVEEFELGELRDEADKLAFLAGYGERQFGSVQQEQASIKAAKLMAGLYEALEGSGYDDHEASVFLVRTLFAMYADDAGVWPERDIFLEFLETRTAEDGSDLGAQLSLLYQVLGTEPSKRQSTLDESMARFPYVNGGVFEGPLSIPSFDAVMRQRLIDASKFNWSSISPAIFGSMFQAVKNKTARRELGEHYTTEPNIMKVISPMFLDELRDQFLDGFYDSGKLQRLRKRMGEMQFLDPACGCGNFLVVAYRELRALDLEVLQQLLNLGAVKPTLTFLEESLVVRIDQFHGIEIEEWPAQIASTAMHLVEHQANMAMELALGMAPETLPLDKVQTIRVGNALRIDWSDVVEPTEKLYVLGNPPFVGYDQRTADQKLDLQVVWGTEKIGRLDYVTGWHAQSIKLFQKSDYDGEFAFVSTNSITQGEPVPLLFGPLKAEGWRIKFAHRTFMWTSEAPDAASVHCNIVGFARGRRGPGEGRLFSYPDLRGNPEETRAKVINAYLLDAADVIVQKRTQPLSPLVPKVANGNVAGDTKRGEENKGGLVMSIEEMEAVRATDSVAAQYVRPFVGGEDFLNGRIRYCLWLTDMDPQDVGQSPELRRRLSNVRDVRSRSTEPSTVKLADTPYLFKHIAQPTTEYVCIPRTVSENRTYLAVGYLSPDFIVSNGSFWAEDPTGLVFAIASSAAFIAWQRAVGGRLKSDPRFANTLTWNTFPVPIPKEAQREAIIEAGSAVLEARALRPGLSLADHYNPLAMTPELVRAHRRLDAAIDSLLGLKGEVDDRARQQALFSSYEKLSGANELAIGTQKRTKRTASAGR